MSETAPWPRMGVYKLPDMAGWMVASRTWPGSFRHVSWQTEVGTAQVYYECTCPAGAQRGRMGSHDETPCRHVLRVAEAERADGLAPRPQGRQDPGVFVD